MYTRCNFSCQNLEDRKPIFILRKDIIYYIIFNHSLDMFVLYNIYLYKLFVYINYLFTNICIHTFASQLFKIFHYFEKLLLY